MAQPVPHQGTDKKRVKVYELRNNDWFDRGTGFCRATYKPVCFAPYPALLCESTSLHLFDHVTNIHSHLKNEGGQKDAIVIVESEDQPERLLLKTKIQKEDGFQKQQGKQPTAHVPSHSHRTNTISYRHADCMARAHQRG